MDEEQKDSEPTPVEQPQPDATAEIITGPKHHFWKSKKFRVVLIIIATLLVIAGVLLAIPKTRYAILGLVVKKEVDVTVVDSINGKVVSQATVKMAGISATTDTKGVARLQRVPVGPHTATVTKKYYKDLSQSIQVPILSRPSTVPLRLVATGRQVPLKVVNKLTGQPLEGVLISVLDTSVKTDHRGQATLVVPTTKTTQSGNLSLSGYNSQAVIVQVTDQVVSQNTFSLAPAGKVYFLSKRTGTINVMKSDLDGANQQVVLAGTGKESDTETSLLASRDWKFLALNARREGDSASLYLVDATTDKMSVLDQGAGAQFISVGWSGHYFIYTVIRTNMQIWQPNRMVLKSFNADTGQITALDQTDAQGSSDQNASYQFIQGVYILSDRLLYNKIWNGNPASNANEAVYSITAKGQNKTTVQSFASNVGIQSIAGKPDSAYYSVYDPTSQNTTFYEFEDAQFKKTTDITQDTFEGFYPTYLISPSGQKTFWYDQRDGKNVLFVGDKSGNQSKESTDLGDYIPYGWYGDDYVLVSKGGSELYILPADLSGKPFKITDYHKPNLNFAGYGYGYGGF